MSRRVWMAVGAGCLGALVLVLVAAAGFAYLLFGALRHSGVYQDALREARRSPAVREALGEPIEPGWFVTGNINVTPASGDAKLAIPLRGPRGRGMLYVEAVKRAGQWQMNLLDLAPSTGARINLLALDRWSDAALRAGCEAGNGAACHALGFRIFQGGDPARRPESARLLRRACEAGEAQGCSDLGACHEHGWGVPPDLAQAAALYQRACDGRSVSGCTFLGHMLDQGKGVAEDTTRAVAAYQKACDGDAAACAFLGEMYDEGRGVARDNARARELYARACDAKDGRGCSHLGVDLMRGDGVARDPARAVELFRQACDGGYALGCFNLGHAHARGAGTARDPVRAAALFRQACEGGVPDACEELENAKEESLDAPRRD